LNLQAYLKEKKGVVEDALRAFFPEPEGPASDVIHAMSYSLFAGGKRLRPILCLAGAAAVGGVEKQVLPVACAIELIHTYSLIHDDLPVMDDDDLRRGKPTSHKKFGEAVALLAGDGLLTEAFRLMTDTELSDQISPRTLIKVMGLIAGAAGYEGMVGGQTVDIQSEGKQPDIPLVTYIHAHKTGALITASVAAGALLGGGDSRQVAALQSYGEKIGQAFQISDDILNVLGDRKTLGKEIGSDEKKGKMTYPAVFGLEKSFEIQSELVEKAVARLEPFGSDAAPLKEIARYIIKRNQ
jgi:geranylgeranyl diphosphate synthase type II